MQEGAAGHGRTVEKWARTEPPEGSARETATGRLSGVSVVRSRKKEREAPESRVKVWVAEADVVPESADSPAPGAAGSLAPRAAASLVPRAAASPAPRAAASMPGIHSSEDSIIIKIKDRNTRPKQLAPARDLSSVGELVTPSVCQAAEATLGGVRTPTQLTRAVASALTNSTSAAATSTTASTSTTSARSATAAASSASTAATSAPTPATTPTTTPTPSAASTAPASSSSALAPLALAEAASSARGRRRGDRLRTKERWGGGDLQPCAALQPCAPCAPCCPAAAATALAVAATALAAALRAPRALQPCCAPRALLPSSPVRPAALLPCAPCCPAAAATALAVAATALAAALRAPCSPAAPRAPCSPARPARPAVLLPCAPCAHCSPARPARPPARPARPDVPRAPRRPDQWRVWVQLRDGGYGGGGCVNRPLLLLHLRLPLLQLPLRGASTTDRGGTCRAETAIARRCDAICGWSSRGSHGKALAIDEAAPQTSHLPVLLSNGDPYHSEPFLRSLHIQRQLLYRIGGITYPESTLVSLHLQPDPTPAALVTRQTPPKL
ncbi:unnamed protein product [Closterium sp. NIES-54]